MKSENNKKALELIQWLATGNIPKNSIQITYLPESKSGESTGNSLLIEKK